MPRKISFREDAFDVVTEESAYWVGFLMADGSVSRNKNSETFYVKLALGIDDRAHVESFRRFLGSSHKLSIVSGRGYPGSRATVGLSIGSRRLADALARFGVTTNKTAGGRLVGLEDNRHAMRGLLDGDGCIFLSGNRPHLGFTGNPHVVRQFLEYVRTFIPETLAKVAPNHSIKQVRFTCRQAFLIVKALYEGCTISLPRKKAIADTILRDFAHYDQGGGRHPVMVTWDGKTQTIRAWARELGIHEKTLGNRIHRWSLERAMTTPSIR